MKKAFKVIGIGLGSLVLLVAAFCGYVLIVGIPTYDPPATPTITVEITPARVDRGEAIAHLQCMACHANNENRLTGKYMDDIPAMFGKIYSKNITQDPEKGIGKWSDGDIIYFLRTGVRPDGTFAAIMPKYALMADEDIKSVVAWLRSDRFPVQPSTEEAPEVEYSFVSKLLAHTMIKPVAYPTQPILMPDTADQVAFGKYTANAVADCYACHSADLIQQDKLNPERSKGFYGGGIEMPGKDGKPVFTANLTFDDQTGIANKYTKEQFIRVVKLGVRPDGTILRYPMEPRPSMSDSELGAIYEYLKTVPKIHNDIAQKYAKVQEKQLASK
ncbi:cytochrome c [Nibrella viscosa]|uniref:Cytochrome c n=1 Tax=Nibrella viscosa TaxID=1084524 RepID=A0ABP8JZP7_9BACT